MRIAILSDIHSNYHALTKAFGIIDRSNVDTVYCLGDIVGYGANPNECISLIKNRCEYSVLGNHDFGVIDPTYQTFTKPGRIAIEWTRKVLTPDNLEFLRALPLRIETDLLTLVHAAPDAPTDWEYVQSLQSAERQFESFSKEVCFIGHTHVPLVCAENLKTFVFKKGMRFLINVGSVGQPRDGNPQLSFGIFDTSLWTYKNVREDYDIADAAQAIIDAGLPSLLGKRLFEGQ